MLKFFKSFATIRLQWRFWILCWFWKQYRMDFVIRCEKTRKKYYGGKYNRLPSKTTVYLLDWNNSCWLFIFSKWFPNHPIRSISGNRLFDNNRIRQGCRNIWFEYHYWCIRRMTHNLKLCAVLHPKKDLNGKLSNRHKDYVATCFCKGLIWSKIFPIRNDSITTVILH